ncbi:MAG TPA: hypothetical protein VLZ51_08295 [Brevundimonas sp.]|nr:hypothetical protein [Brevundimonas sp.]HUH24046.1 hypothetical protein [Brevundimonas sp.]
MNQLIVKRLLLATSLSAAAFLAACSDPQSDHDYEAVEIQSEEPAAPAAEESAAPAVAEAPAATEAPAPVDAIPHDERTSEQTVQPESDTLFY